MRGFAKKVGAISVTAVDLDDTDGPVCCQVPSCTRMALERVTICGYPAGFLCTACARGWLKTWAELLAEEDVPMEMAA